MHTPLEQNDTTRRQAMLIGAEHAHAGWLTLIRRDAWVPAALRARLAGFQPKSELGRYIRECLRFLPAEMAAELVERVSRVVVCESRLSLVVVRHPGSPYRVGPLVEDHGLVSQKVVTTVGMGFIIDAFQNLVELENMKYHGLGTGSTAEAVGDTALVTELSTAYNPDSTRATGTTAEGASANIFSSVATNTVDGTAAVVEHGLFSSATAGAGVLFDRSVFSVINLAASDSIQSTYEWTANTGG